MLKKFLLGFCLISILTACSHDEKPIVTEPAGSMASPTTPTPEPVAQPYCYKWPFPEQPPLFLKEHGVMVTKIMNPCTTFQGAAGFEKGTSWLAMGLPCTGGSGRVEWKGYYANPKMVSFIISNSCPMQPARMEDVMPLGVKVLQLDQSARLLAYYPFSVHFWELDEFREADTGFVVELRSATSLRQGWSRFKKGMPLYLKLYGRENAWVKGHDFFQLDVELIRTAQDQFQLNLLSAKALTQEEREAVQLRCQRLRPRRNCSGL